MIRRSQTGATLIELVIAIVIITMAASTIVGLLAFMSRNSADAMVQAQSTSIANAYLTHILGQPFASIDSHVVPSGGLIRDAQNNGLTMPDYSVEVVVTQPGLPGIPSNETRLVTVTVTSPLGDWVTLSGFKTAHP